jgi:hypothetical protein
VGLSKSEMKFKDYLWFLNENETPNNQIVFDKSFKNFNIDDIIFLSRRASDIIKRNYKDNTNKDLKLLRMLISIGLHRKTINLCFREI